MTSLQLAAALIRRNVSNLEELIGLLQTANQRKLAAELRKQAPELPALRSNGRPHCDPRLWLIGRVR